MCLFIVFLVGDKAVENGGMGGGGAAAELVHQKIHPITIIAGGLIIGFMCREWYWSLQCNGRGRGPCRKPHS